MPSYDALAALARKAHASSRLHLSAEACFDGLVFYFSARRAAATALVHAWTNATRCIWTEILSFALERLLLRNLIPCACRAPSGVRRCDGLTATVEPWPAGWICVSLNGQLACRVETSTNRHRGVLRVS